MITTPPLFLSKRGGCYNLCVRTKLQEKKQKTMQGNGCDVCTMCCTASHFRSSSRRTTLKAAMFVGSFAPLITAQLIFFFCSCVFFLWIYGWNTLCYLSCQHSEDTNVDTNHRQGVCCLMRLENRVVLYMAKSESYQSHCSWICSQGSGQNSHIGATILALVITNHQRGKACH